MMDNLNGPITKSPLELIHLSTDGDFPFLIPYILHAMGKESKMLEHAEDTKAALSEVIAQNDINCYFMVIGAPDKQFIEYGEREWFHEKYSLSGIPLVEKIFNFLIK